MEIVAVKQEKQEEKEKKEKKEDVRTKIIILNNPELEEFFLVGRRTTCIRIRDKILRYIHQSGYTLSDWIEERFIEWMKRKTT